MMSVQEFKTFFFKSKCKFCKTGPKNTYYIFNKFVTEKNLFNFKNFNENYVSSKTDDFYLENSIKSRRFKPSYMFDSTSVAFRKLPVPNLMYDQNGDKLNTVFECGCGRTSWSFTNSTRNHVVNRKCGIVLKVKELLYSTEYKVLINA